MILGVFLVLANIMVVLLLHRLEPRDDREEGFRLNVGGRIILEI